MAGGGPERGDELFVWQEQEPNGSWGTIAAAIPGISGMAPLVFRDRMMAMRLRAIAVAHGRASGHPVRLARFQLDEVEVAV
jgi:hypothetical protein